MNLCSCGRDYDGLPAYGIAEAITMGKDFYIKRGSKVFGPYTQTDMQKLQQVSKLKSDDLISDHKEGPWKPLADVAASRPSVPPAESREWPSYFVQIKGKTHGPYSPLQLKELEVRGKLNIADYISGSEAGPWVKYGIRRDDVAIYLRPEEVARIQAKWLNKLRVTKDKRIASGEPFGGQVNEALVGLTEEVDEYQVEEQDVILTQAPLESPPTQPTKPSKPSKNESEGSFSLTLFTFGGMAIATFAACAFVYWGAVAIQLQTSKLIEGNATREAGKESYQQLDIIKNNLLDPDSYRHIATHTVRARGSLEEATEILLGRQVLEPSITRVRYRAASTLGNMVLSDMYFFTDFTGSVIAYDDLAPEDEPPNGDIAAMARHEASEIKKTILIWQFESNL